MIRIAFLILGLAAGFLAGWILRGPDAPSRSAQRQAERLEPAETREGRPESGQRSEERGAHEGDRPATPRRAPRVETAITRQALRAVQDGEFYGFPEDLYGWDLPDPRWILGQTWLASRIHSDRFADLDVIETMYSFYEQMYGMDRSAVDDHIVPQLTGSVP